MSSNAIFFGWNRSLPGRERLSAEHFQEFVQYLAALQLRGSIDGFEPVFLEPHGGDLNGFILIRGEQAKLDALQASDDWVTHMTRAMLHLDGSGVARALTGDLVHGRMALWTGLIPSS
ncbi:hypothetical protein [Pseudogulbenkiania subflava]|uniref:Uncharacterized protein n=1 Tax=Pseudogulbenkiania subflava DSM 22618 TaxID=1123014 RepID=A0A1Y6BRP0_9NEIS|nr:hypothetical protein [Pseudogulbenkiania subflava]SMF24710.1 hypothetical protein SAMN02745746_02113 [Pseudogulbenkiania subflava DSM 22618]